MQTSTYDASIFPVPQELDGHTWTLCAAVRRCAERWPDRCALQDGTTSRTFEDLDRRCDAAAAQLRSRGVQAGDHVLVLGTKDVDTATVLLAVSRAGATFVPVDRRSPSERLRFFVRDTQPRAVLCPKGMETQVSDIVDGAASILSIEELADARRASEQALNALPSPDGNDVAYVIYTSGSTGLPKGVQIEHGSILAFLRGHAPRAMIRPGDRCMNTGPCHFDVFVMDVLVPLVLGATVFLTHEMPMPTQLLATIERHRITHFYAVGTVLGLMTGDGSLLDRYDLSSLQVLQTGAEVCSVNVINQWLERLPNLRLINSYGPTEATVGCTSYVHEAAGPFSGTDVPIGFEHADTRVLLLSDDGRVVDGVAEEGELLVSGPQLMRGYLNRPLEERRAFIEIAGERYYRTGDYAWRDEEGQLRYRGRRDDEVKVNGLRVHLNEVRRCIRECPDVSSCAVGVVEHPRGGRRLACVLVPTDPPSRSLVRSLSNQLADKLPRAIVPSIVAFAESIPQLPSGKTDETTPIRLLETAVARHPGSAFVMRSRRFEPLTNR